MRAMTVMMMSILRMSQEKKRNYFCEARPVEETVSLVESLLVRGVSCPDASVSYDRVFFESSSVTVLSGVVGDGILISPDHGDLFPVMSISA